MAAFSAALLGRLDEALQLARRAVDLDPLNALSWEGVGELKFYFMGQPDEAAADIKKALELNSDSWFSHISLSRIYIVQGRPQDALLEIGRVPEADYRLNLYALAYHELGRKREADGALNELVAKYQAIDPYLIAEVYAFRNQHNEAFEWLDQSYATHDDSLMQTRFDPLLNSIHNDLRYAALLKKLNLLN